MASADSVVAAAVLVARAVPALPVLRAPEPLALLAPLRTLPARVRALPARPALVPVVRASADSAQAVPAQVRLRALVPLPVPELPALPVRAAQAPPVHLAQVVPEHPVVALVAPGQRLPSRLWCSAARARNTP